MNRKQIIRARRKILADIDSARIAAAKQVLFTTCNVVPIKFTEEFCSVTPKIFAIHCPYHGNNASLCSTCDHMITFNKTESIVYCMKDMDLKRQTEFLEGKAPKKVLLPTKKLKKELDKYL